MNLLLDILLALWVIYLGASIGSFANVVAWRLPRGRSFASGRSHCPRCDTQLRFSENLPILGWLLLKGKCRHCNAPIPIRYFLVEIAYGAAFLLVYMTDLRFASPTTPWYEFLAQSDFRPLLYPAERVSLLSFLGILALLRFEAAPVPRALVLVGLAVPLLRYSITLHFTDLPLRWGLTPRDAFLLVLAGLALGLILEFLLGYWGAPPLASSPRQYLGTLGLIWIGAYLGPLALILITGIAGLLATFTTKTRPALPASASLFLATLLYFVLAALSLRISTTNPLLEIVFLIFILPLTALLTFAWSRDLAQSSKPFTS